MKLHHALALTAATLVAGLAQSQIILVDIGNGDNPTSAISGPDANGNLWNDINYFDGVFRSLVDTEGDAVGNDPGINPAGIGFGPAPGTGIGQSNPTGEGLADPDEVFLGPLAIQSATEDHFFNFQTEINYVLSGMDVNETFNIRVLGSRRDCCTMLMNRYTLTTADGVMSRDIQIGGPNSGDGGRFDNDRFLAEFLNVSPDANGEMTLDVSILNGDFAVLTAMQIEVVSQLPSIDFVSQPESAVVAAGGTLTFSASVDSEDPSVTYQWQLDGMDVTDSARISGATTDTLTIMGASLDDVGAYTLVVRGTVVSTSSEPAIGAVRQSPLAFDLNGDGEVDFSDLVAFLNVL